MCHGDTCKIEGVHDVERVVNEKSKTCDPLVKEGGGGLKFTNFAGVEIGVKVEVNCAFLVSSLDT